MSPNFISKEDFYEGSPFLGGPGGGGGEGGPDVLTPTITSLIPDTLPETASTTQVTVTGTNFVSGVSVEVGRVPRPTTFVSETEVTVSYDPVIPGTVDFVAINPGSGKEASSPVPFVVTEVAPPVLTSMDPIEIPQNIPTDMVVTGTGFLSGPDMKAWINTYEVAGAPESDTIFNVTDYTGEGAVTTSIKIGRENRQLSNALSFKVLGTPEIYSLEPDTAVTTDAAATVAVLGNNFLDGAVVEIDGTPQTTTFVSSTMLSVSYDPTTSGTKQFVVRHANGHVSAPSPFTVTEPAAPVDPTITTLSPDTLASDATATTITVTGTNFEAGSVVEIDQAAQTTTFVSATQLTVSFDPTVAATVEFTVRNPSDAESNSVSFVVTDSAPAGPTGVTVGYPSTFIPDDTPRSASLAELTALGPLGQTTEWTLWEFIEIGPPTGAPTGYARWNGEVGGWAGHANMNNLSSINNQLPPWTPAAPFTDDQYEALNDSTWATWDGTTWVARAEPTWPA